MHFRGYLRASPDIKTCNSKAHKCNKKKLCNYKFAAYLQKLKKYAIIFKNKRSYYMFRVLGAKPPGKISFFLI